jgi:hypothetical protein
MKRLKLLLLSCLISTVSFSQINQIKIVSFQVKNTLPAKIDEWNTVPAGLILTAQKPPTVQLKEPKLIIQIKSNGAVICGNNVATAQPISSFEVKTFTTNELAGMLGNCKELKEGSYQICVQFYNLDRIAISNEVCREFKVEGAKAAEDYAPPTLITPDNGKVFTEAELKKPLNFRWTPLVPKPQQPVTYRLRVWQLMQGQNGTAAMRSNQPVIEKDVQNVTQAVVTNLYTGPCKPPYLCDFIWTVQALNKEGKPIGNNNGTSEPWNFSVMGTYGITIQNLVVECPKGNNNYSFTVNVGNPNNSVAVFDKLEVVVVNGVTITPVNIAPTVPAIGSTIPNNGNINVLGSFNYGTPITAVCLKGYIKEQANPLLNTASSYTCDTLYCECDPCKTLGVSLKDDKLTTTAGTSGQILLSGSLTGLNPSVVKKITMELVYYNIEQTGDSNCVKCAENKEWGNFIKPASSYFTGYNPGILNGVNFGREWTWITTVKKDCDNHGNGGGVDNGNPNGDVAKCATCGTGASPADSVNPNIKSANPAGAVIIVNPPPVAKANTFNLPIAVPPGSSLKCCGDKIKVCIRYTIWDFCCHACDVIKCYEIERKP